MLPELPDADPFDPHLLDALRTKRADVFAGNLTDASAAQDPASAMYLADMHANTISSVFVVENQSITARLLPVDGTLSADAQDVLDLARHIGVVLSQIITRLNVALADAGERHPGGEITDDAEARKRLWIVETLRRKNVLDWEGSLYTSEAAGGKLFTGEPREVAFERIGIERDVLRGELAHIAAYVGDEGLI